MGIIRTFGGAPYLSGCVYVAVFVPTSIFGDCCIECFVIFVMFLGIISGTNMHKRVKRIEGLSSPVSGVHTPTK